MATTTAPGAPGSAGPRFGKRAGCRGASLCRAEACRAAISKQDVSDVNATMMIWFDWQSAGLAVRRELVLIAGATRQPGAAPDRGNGWGLMRLPTIQQHYEHAVCSGSLAGSTHRSCGTRQCGSQQQAAGTQQVRRRRSCSQVSRVLLCRAGRSVWKPANHGGGLDHSRASTNWARQRAGGTLRRAGRAMHGGGGLREAPGALQNPYTSLRTLTGPLNRALAAHARTAALGHRRLSCPAAGIAPPTAPWHHQGGRSAWSSP